jgi:hypothetical protein
VAYVIFVSASAATTKSPAASVVSEFPVGDAGTNVYVCCVRLARSKKVNTTDGNVDEVDAACVTMIYAETLYKPAPDTGTAYNVVVPTSPACVIRSTVPAVILPTTFPASWNVVVALIVGAARVPMNVGDASGA